MQTVGTCSKCSGPVQVPEFWGGKAPPVPTCGRCGATAKDPYGPVLPMHRAAHDDSFKTVKIRIGEALNANEARDFEVRLPNTEAVSLRPNTALTGRAPEEQI